jgi:hypothetical protein
MLILVKELLKKVKNIFKVNIIICLIALKFPITTLLITNISWTTGAYTEINMLFAGNSAIFFMNYTKFFLFDVIPKSAFP